VTRARSRIERAGIATGLSCCKRAIAEHSVRFHRRSSDEYVFNAGFHARVMAMREVITRDDILRVTTWLAAMAI